MKFRTYALAALAILPSGHLAAANNVPATIDGGAPAECITLSPQHQGTRFGTQYLLIRDGDAHYRLEFNGACAALHSGSVEVSANRTPNALCQMGTRVTSKSGSCAVRAVRQIDAGEYERYARRARR